MKKLTVLLVSSLLGFYVQGQVEGTITYNETLKISIEGIDESMKDMIPASQNLKKELLFNGMHSVYQNKKGEELEDVHLSSDDGTFQIKFVKDDIENILYKDLENNGMIHQQGMMGKSFVVNSELSKHKWKITPEKIKYLGYVCQKAVIEEGDKFVVAWFTSEIPVQHGPGDYHGLPGVILMLSIDDGKTEMKALSVEMKSLEAGALNKPTDGKKVTAEGFKRIEEEKIKEMQEMYGSDQVKIRN